MAPGCDAKCNSLNPRQHDTSPSPVKIPKISVNDYGTLSLKKISFNVLISVSLIPASLDKHHRTHTGERPFSCDVCEQRFTEKGALVRHKASKHEEGRPHCCHICGKTFKGKIY